MDNSNDRLPELEEKENELGSLRNDLKNIISRITELEQKEKDLELLCNDLQNVISRISELEEKEKELETLAKGLENKTSPPKEQVDKQKTEEAFPEYSSPGKEAFRIDLYPYEGHYQGKAEHLLTKEKKAFKGIDQRAIADFIHEHLPQSEESPIKPEPSSPLPAKSSLEIQIPAFKTVNLRKLTLEQEGKFQKEKSIVHNKIFQVTLVVDFQESIAEKNLPCPFSISVHAKRMGGGFKQILGKSGGKITKAGEFTANVHCAPLPAGIYRFVAFGTINIKDDGKETMAQFHTSSIFIVR